MDSRLRGNDRGGRGQGVATPCCGLGDVAPLIERDGDTCNVSTEG